MHFIAYQKRNMAKDRSYVELTVVDSYTSQDYRICLAVTTCHNERRACRRRVRRGEAEVFYCGSRRTSLCYMEII